MMKLNPCPFCGSASVALSFFAVRCGTCGASGPFASSDDQAVLRWNDRRERPPRQLDEQRGSADEELYRLKARFTGEEGNIHA